MHRFAGLLKTSSVPTVLLIASSATAAPPQLPGSATQLLTTDPCVHGSTRGYSQAAPGGGTIRLGVCTELVDGIWGTPPNAISHTYSYARFADSSGATSLLSATMLWTPGVPPSGAWPENPSGFPDIDGDHIVFQSMLDPGALSTSSPADYSVWLYKRSTSTTTRLSKQGYDGYSGPLCYQHPAVGGNYAAWESGCTCAPSVVEWTEIGTSATLEANATGYFSKWPAISNDVVVFTLLDGAGGLGVGFAHADGSAPDQALIFDPNPISDRDYVPHISDNRLVYSAQNQIFLREGAWNGGQYQWGPPMPIPTTCAGLYPRVGGPGGRYVIYSCASELYLTDTQTMQTYYVDNHLAGRVVANWHNIPYDIHGDTIVYEKGDGSYFDPDVDLYFYDIDESQL